MNFNRFDYDVKHNFNDEKSPPLKKLYYQISSNWNKTQSSYHECDKI